MVDYAYVQGKIYYGYNKAATKIGQEFDYYRAPSAIDPLNIANLLGQVFVSQNVNWAYNKSNSYGNAVWQLLVDGRLTNRADYLVGPGYTFFLNAKEPLLPINGVECNRTVTITRPSLARVPGANPYGGYERDEVLTLASSLPVSILQASRAYSNTFALPLDTKSPTYQVLMPNLPDFEVRIGDFVDDDRGVRLAFTNVERTDFGFRCIALSVQA